MPPKRTKSRKPVSYASVSLTAGRGVGAALNEELTLPTLKPLSNILAQTELAPEIDVSAKQNSSEIPMEHESDVLVVEDHQLQPNPQEDPESQLLALRKRFKRVTSSIIKMHSHLDFIERCKEKSNVPKGLQVKIQCNALLADLSNIGHRFKEIRHKAEEDFIEALLEHYLLTISKLEDDQKILTISMRKICEDNPDSEIVETHQALLEKTKDNISKHKKTLEDKKKKLEALEAPQPKKPRPNPRPQRQKRRGMISNNTNPPISYKDKYHNKPNPTDNGLNNNTTQSNIHVNPNYVQHNGSQAAAFIQELLQHLPNSRQILCQQPATQMGLTYNAMAPQQPSLWGPCATLGRQQPSLSGLGIQDLLPQQPQLQGVGQNFHFQGRPL